MRCFFTFLIFFFLANNTFAQEIISSVENQDDIVNTIGSRQYLFPNFLKGSVIFKKGNMVQSLLNYNILFNSLQFEENGIILNVKNPKEIELVVFNDRALVNVNNGFAEVILQHGTKQLGVRKSIILRKPAPRGGYGSRSETSSIESLAYFDTGLQNVATKLPEEVMVENKIFYYLITSEKKQIANEKSFLRTFSKSKKEIQDYIKQNKIDFEDENQLKQLFTFCVSL